MRTKQLSRTAAREVDCPLCGVRASERCVGVRGRPRESNHRERIEAASDPRRVIEKALALMEQER